MFSEAVKKDLIEKYGEFLANEEERLEAESSTLGYERFKNKLYKDRGNKSITTGTAKNLISEAVPIMSKAVDKFIADSDTGSCGRRHTICPIVKLLSSEQTAYIAIKTILVENLHYSTNLSLTKLSKAIGKNIEDQVRFENFFNTLSKKDQNKVLNGLDKRIATMYKKRYLMSIEKHKIEEGALEAFESWDNSKHVRVGLKLIELFIQSTGLGKITTIIEKGNATYFFCLSNEILNFIDFNDEELASMSFVYRPMVIPPAPWNSPIGGCYYMPLVRPVSFVRLPHRDCVSLYSDVDMPNVYKAVNIIQNTAWRINKCVFDVAQQIVNWKHIPEALEIPSKDPEEPPIRASECDTNEEAQKAWRISMVKYYQEDNRRKSKRLLINAVMSLAQSYKNFEKIYFPHNLDFRGRIYPLTTLSPQGNDFQKGMLEFAEGKELGEEGHVWLAFHGANCYGLDKAPIQERLEWVYSHSDFIRKIAEDPITNLDWTETDSPWEFLAFCFEWNEYLKKGDKAISHLPIAFDGSCSGIQHFSAMLRDEVGGAAVNLIPDSKVHDIYGIVAAKVNEVLKQDAENGTPDKVEKNDEGAEYIKKGTQSLAREWLAHGVTRSVTKRCVMTLPYGAKKFGFKDQILEDTIYPAIQKNVLAFSRPNQSAMYMAGLIWDAVHKVVVKAMEAMAWLQDASALLAKDRDINGNPVPTYWVTPAGFPVWQKYPKTTVTRVSTFLSGELKIYSTYEESDTKLEKSSRLTVSLAKPSEGLDVRRQRQGIAPNFVHSMDASHLMLTIIKCHDEYEINSFAVIHDSYATHACDAGKLFRAVRDVFVDTYKNNDVLQNLHDQIKNMLSSKLVDELPDIPSKGSLDLDQVRQSLYAFA